jgi:hypothetical protein
LTLNSAQLRAADLTLGGSAQVYKVFHADWNLHLKYDRRQLLRIAIQAAKDKRIGREAVEAMLKEVSFDFSAWVKAGRLPLSWVQLSASSLLPLGRPLYGALDRLLPVQVAAMPDSRLLMVGGLVLPKGVAFDTVVPGLGFHYSEYGTRQGVSATVGGVTYPRLTQLGKPGASFSKVLPIFGHVELRGVRRVSDTVDLGFGLTYSYSPTPGGSGEHRPPALEYLPGLRPRDYRGMEYQPWNPVSEDNIPPEQAVAKHRFMFRIEGTHDLLGGR